MTNPFSPDDRRADGMTVLEICVDDATGLAAAIRGGADRIELCSALSIGGLTPTFGFMSLAAKAPIPVNALIRPRAGGFCYSADEVEMMCRDIEAARTAGLAGVVIGALDNAGRLDRDALDLLLAAARGMDVTLHRAFDLTRDLFEALEDAVALGIPRILTSGGRTSVAEGRETIADLTEAGGGRISIMPGGGVNADLAPHLLAMPYLFELHASGTDIQRGGDPRLVEFGFSAVASRETSEEKVRALRVAMGVAA